jgi:DNA-binding NarL/FixJ family response regulator
VVEKISSDNTEIAKRVKVLIVDDQPLTCFALRKILESRPEFVICGEAFNGEEAIQAMQSDLPDLMIVDLMLGDSSGLKLVEEIRSQYPQIIFLIISIHDEAMYAESALRAGASGYVHKLERPSGMLQAVLTVLRGEVYVTEAIAVNLLSKIAGHPERSGGIAEVLTARELQVFELAGEGLGPNEIGERLKINKNTVETYRARIKKKLRFSDAAEMRKEAISWKHSPRA